VAKRWDSLMKRLMEASPQDLVSWILAGAVYEGVLNTELQKHSVSADLIYTVKWKGQHVALHVEFQKRRHGRMDRRVWEYNVLTSVRTGLPVHSVVIYLVKDNSVVEPPYTIQLPTGDIVHHFVFQNIKLWEIPPDVLIQQKLSGLLPLLPLTKEGNRREVVEQMISSLQQVGKKDLLALGYAFSALVFEQEPDQQWLREKFMSMEDILEESWAYQEMVQKGMAKGLKQGLDQGLKQGLDQGLEKGKKEEFIQFVGIRFPTLLVQAKQTMEQELSVQQLRVMLNTLYRANTIEEAQAALRTHE
jgi:predicted transposase YdaD